MQLNEFVCRNMDVYFKVVEEVLEKEQDKGDTIILVRALDRFYRRLQAMNTLVHGTDFVTLVNCLLNFNKGFEVN